jgi:hypothetical protein
VIVERVSSEADRVMIEARAAAATATLSRLRNAVRAGARPLSA